MGEIAASLATDMLIHFPFIYYPVFYACQETISSLNEHRNLDFGRARARWIEMFRDDMVACCSFWGPVNAINFTVSPYHLRVPFVAGVGFIWLAILSAMRGAGHKHTRTD